MDLHPPATPPLPERKLVLREELRGLLSHSLEEREEKSTAICERLRHHPKYLKAEVVALYDGMLAEPEVELLWHLARRRFVYPRVHGPELLLLEVLSPAELEPSSGGAPYTEPPLLPGATLTLPEVDIVLVPGLGFTRSGERIGRGGGFYDRLLARLPKRTWKVGVAFESQLRDELPLEEHDHKLDAVITEAGIYEAH